VTILTTLTVGMVTVVNPVGMALVELVVVRWRGST